LSDVVTLRLDVLRIRRPYPDCARDLIIESSNDWASDTRQITRAARAKRLVRRGDSNGGRSEVAVNDRDDLIAFISGKKFIDQIQLRFRRIEPDRPAAGTRQTCVRYAIEIDGRSFAVLCR